LAIMTLMSIIEKGKRETKANREAFGIKWLYHFWVCVWWSLAGRVGSVLGELRRAFMILDSTVWGSHLRKCQDALSSNITFWHFMNLFLVILRNTQTYYCAVSHWYDLAEAYLVPKLPSRVINVQCEHNESGKVLENQPAVRLDIQHWIMVGEDDSWWHLLVPLKFYSGRISTKSRELFGMILSNVRVFGIARRTPKRILPHSSPPLLTYFFLIIIYILTIEDLVILSPLAILNHKSWEM
jgi:hypothetical protein